MDVDQSQHIDASQDDIAVANDDPRPQDDTEPGGPSAVFKQGTGRRTAMRSLGAATLGLLVAQGIGDDNDVAAKHHGGNHKARKSGHRDRHQNNNSNNHRGPTGPTGPSGSGSGGPGTVG